MRQFATLICSRGNGEFDVADTSENALSDYAVGSQAVSYTHLTLPTNREV